MVPQNKQKLAWLATHQNYPLQKKQIRDNYAQEFQFEFPGLKQITGNDKGFCNKIIWTAVIFASLFTCTYQISNRIALFAQNPIRTEVIVQQNHSVKFPSFIVCPLKETMEMLVPYKKIIANETGIPFCKVDARHIMERFNVSLFNLWSNLSVENLIEIPSKLFQWERETTLKNGTLLVVRDLSTLYGMCKKITIPELVTFRKENTMMSLKSKPGYNSECRDSPVAFTVFVRDDDDHIRHRPYSDIINVQHNIATTYGIVARQYAYINTAENPCANYSVVNKCRHKCIDEHVLKSNLICKLPDALHLDLPNCTTAKEIENAIQLGVYEARAVDIRRDCNCPRPCEETTYSTVYKYSEFTFNCKVEIYFDDNKVDFMREYYSYTIIPLLCDIGGNLGLFLGLCIPTVLENIQNSLVYIKRKMISL